MGSIGGMEVERETLELGIQNCPVCVCVNGDDGHVWACGNAGSRSLG